MTEEEKRERKKIADKKYREAHKEQIKNMHKKWREKNRKQINEKAKEKYKDNPEMFKKNKEKYVSTHKEQVKKANHLYKVNNRNKCTEYERNKRKNDPVYRFRCCVRNLIRKYTKERGYMGNKTTYEILGCDFNYFLDFIKNQFTEGMTLENYGKKKENWNIDHIIPISMAKTDADLERLNHYTNLRPLWASENYKKSKKLI